MPAYASEDRFAFSIRGIDESQTVFAGLLLCEIEDAVLGRSQAGHERGPSRKRNRGSRTREPARMALLHPPTEIGKLTLRNHGPDHVEGGAVQGENQNRSQLG
jgi:hypothetical protein